VHKKTVRRRRAVLVGLVALSLILLTAYFGESAGGGLHAIQRGFLTVISPIEAGASDVARPIRNAFGSIGDAFGSGSEASKLRREVARLRLQAAAYEGEARAYRELAAGQRVDAKLSLGQYRPVNATVIGASPTIWYETVTIDAGTPEGVHDNDPVIGGEGYLVGKVSLSTVDGSQVMLLTDHEMAVAARLDKSGAWGMLRPKVGEPNDLVLEYLPPETQVNPGEYVVTSGTVAGGGESLFPPGIPVGVVTSGPGNGAYTHVNVRPLANLHSLSAVRVLTIVNGSAPSRLTHLVSSMSIGGGLEGGAGSGSGLEGGAGRAGGASAQSPAAGAQVASAAGGG
jgi:rod shape-determining protein MreC